LLIAAALAAAASLVVGHRPHLRPEPKPSAAVPARPETPPVTPPAPRRERAESAVLKEPANEAERLMAELRDHAPTTIRPELMRAHKDAMLERLHDMEPLPEGVADFFVELYRDANQDEAVRDYALQHMGPLYERLLALPDREADRGTLRNEMWSAAASGEGTYGGTALLALAHLGDQTPDIDRDRLRAEALRLAAEGDAPSRIAALSLCARLDAAEVLPAARLAVEDRTNLPLRMAALNALARLGGDDDLARLRELAADPADATLRAAAQRALLQFEKRKETGNRT
jgi:hypothetical protein